ncbi:tetratricopeptide repeat protein [Fusobacterium sp. PH5-44]|uniref:tetratricopeptide repeat protein n=1 Tax=unclassified Fusobacterium TaxID=2648384 RepID=UPI003D202AE3
MKKIALLIIIFSIFTFGFAPKKAEELQKLIKKYEKVSDAKIKKRADRGNKDAQIVLGVRYLASGVNDDIGEQYFIKAADKGDILAQLIVGELSYERDDKLKAEKYLKMAADQGDTEAQYAIGEYYYHENQKRKAQEYFKKAAENGHDGAVAMYKIMEMDKLSGAFGAGYSE